MLREIAGHHVVFPLGSRTVEFTGVITLNASGAFLWESLAADITEDELLKLFMAEYAVDEDTARNDLQEFLGIVRENNLLDEEE